MIYHLPEQISVKTRSSFMHYIITCTFNIRPQFIQLIHYPPPPLVFYHFIACISVAALICLF